MNLKAGMNRNRKSAALCALLMMICTSVGATEEGAVVYRPLKFGGVQEFGTIYQGQVGGLDPQSFNQEIDGEWIDHFGTFLEQDVIINNRLNLQLGLGGIFEFPKPEIVNPDLYGSMYKGFFFGPSIAKVMYGFGNPEKPVFSLGGGMFPFKYNSDAADLGEYLFRSGPYPTYIMTGGLTFVNDNAAYLQGFQASLRLGNLKVDGFLTTETSMPPLYDWSLAFVANYEIAGGLVDVGAGVNFKRLIPVRPSRTQPEVPINAYFERNGTYYNADLKFYQDQMFFYKNQMRIDSSNKSQRQIDSITALWNAATVDSLGHWLNPADPRYVSPSEFQYYTSAGTLVMAMVSLDLKKITGLRTGDAPFKIFAEGAILGIKDYPIFYEHWWQRAPIMVGIHLPTFGLLDQLTVQYEYFNSPWGNDFLNLGGNGGVNLPLPDIQHDFGSSIQYGSNQEFHKDALKNDNVAWAVLLKRKLYSHLYLSAQASRDHMRTFGREWFFNGSQEPNEVLYRNSSWYWMVQLGWGL